MKENNVIFEKQAIEKFCKEIKSYEKVFIITSPTPCQKILPFVSNLLNENKVTFWTHCLEKDATCSSENVLKACAAARNASVVVAFGAGTVCDISKLVAKKLDLPLVVVATTLTHFGIFSNIAYLNNALPQIVETSFPTKVYLDENLILKSPEKFINSTLCFCVSVCEKLFSIQAESLIGQCQNVDCFALQEKIKKIEQLTGWLALSKNFAVLNLMDYVFDLSQILENNTSLNNVVLASLLNCSTLKNNFGEKALLCSQILLRTYTSFFKQKNIVPASTPCREKIILLLSKKVGANPIYVSSEDFFNNFINETNCLLNNKILTNFQENRLKMLEKCLEFQLFISKFLNKINLINSEKQQIRMIDENELFCSLEIFPLFCKANLPKAISRYGNLNVV